VPSANTLPRIMWVHRQLKNEKHVTTKDISERFGGSVRTAQRTIEYMRDQLHAPVEYDRHRCTFYYLDNTYELPSLNLTDGETIALLLVYESMLQKLPLPLARELAGAVSRLQDFLPTTTSVNLADLLARFSIELDPQGDVRTAHLDEVRRALSERRTLRMTYYTASRDELLERDLDPYHVTYRRGDWYVVGHCHLRKHVQTFAVSRMRALTLTERRFEIAPDFDVSQYFEHAFGVDIAGEPTDVVLEFVLPEARYVGERTWHPSQRLEKLDDGRLRLRLTVSVTYELRQWILSYGSRVRVLSPASLAEQVGAELRRAAEGYAS